MAVVGFGFGVLGFAEMSLLPFYPMSFPLDFPLLVTLNPKPGSQAEYNGALNQKQPLLRYNQLPKHQH